MTGHYYSFFYRDRLLPDGSSKSVFTRFDLGLTTKMSEHSARREHDRLRQQINRERGSVPTAPKGETFEEVTKLYMRDIAPQLSIATVRQRKSHLNGHLLPRFRSSAINCFRSSCAVSGAVRDRACQRTRVTLQPSCQYP
jgi:hypothetical protein